jgi:hypothetical protein
MWSISLHGLVPAYSPLILSPSPSLLFTQLPPAFLLMYLSPSWHFVPTPHSHSIHISPYTCLLFFLQIPKIYFLILFFNIIVLGVHYDIYKSSYIIVEFTSPSFSFIYPHSWSSFNRSHFSIYMHVYLLFPPYSPSYTFSLYLPHSYWYQPPR